MKLNKTLMMAALVAGGLLAGLPLHAQDSTNTPPPAAGMRRAPFSLDAVAKQLDLTDDQKTKVKPILEDMQKKLTDLRTDTTLAQADRRAKQKEIRDAAATQLKEILTPDQYAKWEKMAAGNRRPAPTPPAAPDAAPKN